MWKYLILNILISALQVMKPSQHWPKLFSLSPPSVVKRNGKLTGPNTLAVRRVSNCLVRDGLVSDPDIWEHLKYLYDMGSIEFTNKKITPDTAYKQDGVARLTMKGVRFIENGGDPESGIDL